MPGALGRVAEMLRAVLEVAGRAGMWGSRWDGWLRRVESIFRNWLCEALLNSGCGLGLKGLSGLWGVGGQEATVGGTRVLLSLLASARRHGGGTENFWPGFRVRRGFCMAGRARPVPCHYLVGNTGHFQGCSPRASLRAIPHHA